jgi:hypothetical protein
MAQSACGPSHARGRQPCDRYLLELAKFEIIERLPEAAEELQQIMVRALHNLRAGNSIERAPHVDRRDLQQCAYVRSRMTFDPRDRYTPTCVIAGRPLKSLRHRNHKWSRISAQGGPAREYRRDKKKQKSDQPTHR